MTLTASRRPAAGSTLPAARSARCAVVVVNYGSHQLLERNLTPLQRADPELMIVVVDNFTTELERETLRRLGAQHRWDVIAEPLNLGFGAGVNRGVQRALSRHADQFLLLNPDATIAVAEQLDFNVPCTNK